MENNNEKVKNEPIREFELKKDEILEKIKFYNPKLAQRLSSNKVFQMRTYFMSQEVNGVTIREKHILIGILKKGEGKFKIEDAEIADIADILGVKEENIMIRYKDCCLTKKQEGIPCFGCAIGERIEEKREDKLKQKK